jgi:hypothetical protein
MKEIEVGDICEISGEGKGVLWVVTGVTNSVFTAERLADGEVSGWVGNDCATVLSPRVARVRLAEMLDQLVAAAARVALARQGLRSR